MSVLKSERDESSLSYFYNAITLRKELTLLLLRDFGVKDKYRKFKDFSQHFSFFDRHIFQHLLKKYKQEHIIYSYPSWLIDYCRKNILKSCASLIENITLAHNIHPNYSRRSYWKKNINR